MEKEGKLTGLKWKIFLGLLIPLDVLAALSWLSGAPCIGGGLGDQCSPMKPEIIIPAILLTGFYLYKRYKASGKPFSWKGDSKLGWLYWLYLWFSLVFIGETLPQLAGIWRGKTPGEYGYHFGLLDNLVGFISSGRVYDFLLFSLLALGGVLLFRYLYWPIATLVAAAFGATIEYYLFNPAAGYYDTYNPELNFLGTIIFLVSSWVFHFLVSFTIFNQIIRIKKVGQIIAVTTMIAANVFGILYVNYHKKLNPEAYKNKEETVEKIMLEKKTCPDKLLFNNGPLVAYVGDKEASIMGGQEDVDWIMKNCPKMEKVYK